MFLSGAIRTPLATSGLVRPSKNPLNDGRLLWLLNLPYGRNGLSWFDLFKKTNGTLTNTPTWVATPSGGGRPGGLGAVKCVSASSQWVNLGSPILTAMPLTLAGWIKPASLANNHALLTIHNNAGNGPRWHLGISNSDAIEALHRDTSTFGRATTASSFITTGVWYHIVGVFTSTTSRTIYVNGVLQATDTTSVTGSMSTVNETAAGRYSAAAMRYLDGQSDDLSIWNRALDDKQVLALYHESLAGNPNTLEPVSTTVHSFPAGSGTTPVGLADNLLWNLRATVGLGDRELWNDRTTVGKGDRLLWNDLISVSSPRTLLWNDLISASFADSLLWNERTTVGKADAELWNDLATAGKMERLLWNLQATAGRADRLLWGLGGPVGVTPRWLWNDLLSVWAAKRLPWNDLVSVSQKDAASWHERTTVASPKRFLWSLGGPVGILSRLLWNDLISVSKPDLLSWHERQLASRKDDLTWLLRNTANSQKRLLWQELASVGVKDSALWRAGLAVSYGDRLSWSARTTAAGARSLLWQTLFNGTLDPLVVDFTLYILQTVEPNLFVTIEQKLK